MAKKVALQPTVRTSGNLLVVRPGFLEDDDADAIQNERKVVKGKGKQVSKVNQLTNTCGDSI